MLFGLERKRGRAALSDDWSRYESWDYRGRYGGSLIFESGGRTFQVERSFDRNRKQEKLFCLDDGEELSVEQGDLEMLLCQMSEKSYRNSIALEQNLNLSREALAEELRNQAANYSGSRSDAIDVAQALAYLKDKRREAERKLREIETENDRNRHALEQKRAYLLAEKERKEESCRQLSGERDARQNENQKDSYKVKRDPVFVMIAVVVSILAIVLGAIRILSFPWNLLLVAAAVIMEEIWYVINRHSEESGQQSAPSEDGEEADFSDHDWRRQVLREDIRELNSQLQNLDEELRECVVGGSDYGIWKRKQQVYLETEERIRTLSSEMIQSSGNSFGLAERMSEIMSEITRGKYSRVYLDEVMNCSVYTNGGKVPAEQLSRGTLELLMFALRMAAAEELYEEPMPVVLDDAFAYYDDERLAAVLRWLSENREQVLLFTCQRREEETMQALGLRYWKVEL
jgi:hypothetical protein